MQYLITLGNLACLSAIEARFGGASLEELPDSDVPTGPPSEAALETLRVPRTVAGRR